MLFRSSCSLFFIRPVHCHFELTGQILFVFTLAEGVEEEMMEVMCGDDVVHHQTQVHDEMNHHEVLHQTEAVMSGGREVRVIPNHSCILTLYLSML